ncbi:MAG: PKD domain-containing protein [Hyalangium sp.]|uniref:PKD domain-containing protein n=1 Tax=Hyalangium sp. TaxID=2028555 RepID=UPI00389A3F57
MSRRRKTGIAALGAGLLVVLVACLWRNDTPPSTPPPPPPAMPGPTRVEAVPAPAPPPVPAAEAPPTPAEAKADPAAPIIDDVTVEKTEVCEGEENLVSVRAHTPDGTDAFLHYAIGGRLGPRVPLRSWIADDGESPKLQIQVFGKNNVMTMVDVPPFTVKQCKPQRMALITSHLRANTWSEFDFEVKLMENPTPGNASFVPFQPRKYEWTFGDGETATTELPSVTHNFEARKQDAMFSNLLVEVKVYGNADEPVLGRASLQLMNPAFEDLATKGVVTLLVQFTPRFPELGSDGVVRQKVRLFHMRDKPVFIHNAQVFKHLVNPTGPSPQQVVDPSSLLGTSIIPPGRGIEFEAKLDTNKDPDVFSMEFTLEGKDSEGLPVRGAYSVMRPPPKPTKEKSDPVLDPMLKEKILAARKLLNKPYVTDEDLWALERQGKFAEINARFANEQAAAKPSDPRDAPPKPGPPPEGPTAAPGTGGEHRPHTPPKPGSR